ncbi:MAG: restriction endonuclease subunit S [bacterium]|nr:restriction endonuclease subunit S [bacterium]
MTSLGDEAIVAPLLADWRSVTFGQCARLIRDSVSPSPKGDTPYVGLQHIGQGTLSLLSHGLESDITSTKTTFRLGDTLFGKLRPYFRKVIRAPFDGICSTDIWVVRPTEGVDQDFLYYIMASQDFVDFATAGSEGTRMPRAQWEHVSRYEVSLPSHREQQAIAHVLRTLDNKIELNHRINETLEEMARTLFKSWFVNFDPVRAKTEGRWQPGQSLPGLPAHLYNLFPDRLVPSELGKVPEGWEVGTVGDYYRVTMGQSPPGRTYNDVGDGLPFFQGCTDFGFRYPTKRRFCTAPSRITAPQDTLVSVRAPVGDINMAWETSCIGRGVAALRHRSGSSSLTYYSALTIQHEIQQYEHTGTVFGAITKKQIMSLPTVEPPAVVIEQFGRYVLPLDQLIRQATAQVRALTSLRDALLTQLVSGKVQVGVN